MRTFRSSMIVLAITVLLPGCVKRVQEAPGLVPGSPYMVQDAMRGETFDVGDYEVRSYRIPLTGENRRRFQFLVLNKISAIQERSFSVVQLPDGTWALTEERPDGISVTQQTWSTEPSYQAAKIRVSQLIAPRG